MVLQLSCSTDYSKLDAVAKNLIAGIGKMLETGKIRFSIFLDGPTLEKAGAVARPLSFGRFRKAVEDGYLDVLGGGFNDPMLPFFPTELQSLQLSKHQKILHRYFGMEPAGYYNSSMVWEMEMTELLDKNRFEYALVLESALQDALGRSTPVSGWYTVEDKGSLLKVVPVSESLSQAIANDDFNWMEIAEPYCRDGKSAVVVLDIPPAPGDIVPYFERLIDFIETNDVITKTVSSVVCNQASEGRLSFLLSAGHHIGLPSTAKTCREVLIRRPEVNLLHKTLLSLYRRGEATLKDKNRQKFLEMLLPAMSPMFYRDLQDFQGMRTPSVRYWGSKYLSLASSFLAENISFDGVRLGIADFLMEGRKLISAETHSYAFLLDYFAGGVMRFINSKMATCDIMSGWRDDGEPTFGFLDYLLPNLDFSAAKMDQLLVDRENVLRAPYDYQIKRHETGTDLLLHSEQPLVLDGQEGVLHVEKCLGLFSSSASFELSFHLENAGFTSLKGFFGTLLEMGLVASDRNAGSILVDGKKIKFNFTEPLIYPEAKSVEIIDDTASCHVRLEFKNPANLLLAPMLGASSSAAPDALHGIKVSPFWKVSMESLSSFDTSLKVRLSGR